MIAKKAISGAIWAAIFYCSWLPEARAACSTFINLEPDALLSDGSNSTRLEVITSSDVTAVRWDLHQFSRLQVGGVPACTANLSFALHDDGTYGDRQAGDHIFTIDGIRFDPAAAACGRVIQGRGRTSGLGNFALGSIVVTKNTGEQETHGNSNFRVLDADFFRVTDEVLRLGPNAQASTHVLNVLDNDHIVDRSLGRLTADENSSDPMHLIRNLYSVLPDDFDFIHAFSAVGIPCSGGIGGFHVNVKNTITGIGRPQFDHTADVGSAGRLQGYSFLADGTGDYLHHHEMMHQWAAYLDPSLGLAEGGFGVHWGLNNNIAGAVGGCYWIENPDGTFTLAGRITETLRYPDLELYLMGLI